MRNFMMGLMGAGKFDPPPTDEEMAEYASLSAKFAKVAGGAGLSFSKRERLADLTNSRLDKLADERGMADAEGPARTVRSLLSNVF